MRSLHQKMGYPPIYSVRNLRADPQLITDLEVKAQSTSRKDGAVTVSGQVARSSRLTTLELSLGRQEGSTPF